jgi:hypothetical protein
LSNAFEDELRFRYYATIFLVNRPVLYHVLYEKYENHLQSSDGSVQDPWVYESCHNCVQNATMIILLHSKRHQTMWRDYFENWCNLQHLIAAYAIILQGKSRQSCPWDLETLLASSSASPVLIVAQFNIRHDCRYYCKIAETQTSYLTPPKLFLRKD